MKGGFILRHVWTLTAQLRVAALAVALFLPAHASRADGSVATDNAWIAFLKCQDLIGRSTTSINHQSFPIYSMWLRGYIAGVSSIATISITEKIKFSDVAASVLIYCTTHPKISAVDAAVHVGSLFYNVLNSDQAIIDLHNPGTPPLQE